MVARISALVFFVVFAGCCFASSKIHKVKAAYTYYASPTESPEQAKRIALERAKVEAMAEKFGTVVSQSNSTMMTTQGDKSVSRFHSVSGTDVRGEWVETIGEPEYDVSFTDNTLVVNVSVEGKIRELKPNGIDFVAKSLRNGTELKYEDTEFVDGDDLYLYFKTPVKGYVATFLLDETAGECYCLLPYKSQDGMPVEVKKDKDYIFFSETKAEENCKGLVDEYNLVCGSGVEFNTLYVIFSPEEFSRPVGISGDDMRIPVSTPHRDFLRWLSKLRSKNDNINCITIPLQISEKK